jgi:RimJ/RimL family protein N-acetyltransferase
MSILPPHAAEPPQKTQLEGGFVRIEPLDPERHGRHLWQEMAGHDPLWTYMAYGPFNDQASFQSWLESRAKLDDPLSFAIIEKSSGRALGIATLMEIRPSMGVIEIGHILFSPAMQRTPCSTEAVFLLMHYSFETLGYRRFEWKCNNDNAPSRSAAARFGFTFEGVFRQHMIVKGRNRDTAWFSIIDSEWPERKKAFETWLSPDNFDENGRQLTSLSALNAS